jgi:hypothetical protein
MIGCFLQCFIAQDICSSARPISHLFDLESIQSNNSKFTRSTRVEELFYFLIGVRSDLKNYFTCTICLFFGCLTGLFRVNLFVQGKTNT